MVCMGLFMKLLRQSKPQHFSTDSEGSTAYGKSTILVSNPNHTLGIKCIVFWDGLVCRFFFCVSDTLVCPG